MSIVAMCLSIKDALERCLFPAQFSFHVHQVLHNEKLENIHGKYLKLPGSGSTKNTVHSAK